MSTMKWYDDPNNPTSLAKLREMFHREAVSIDHVPDRSRRGDDKVVLKRRELAKALEVATNRLLKQMKKSGPRISVYLVQQEVSADKRGAGLSFDRVRRGTVIYYLRYRALENPELRDLFSLRPLFVNRVEADSERYLFSDAELSKTEEQTLKGMCLARYLAVVNRKGDIERSPKGITEPTKRARADWDTFITSRPSLGSWYAELNKVARLQRATATAALQEKVGVTTEEYVDAFTRLKIAPPAVTDKVDPQDVARAKTARSQALHMYAPDKNGGDDRYVPQMTEALQAFETIKQYEQKHSPAVQPR